MLTNPNKFERDEIPIMIRREQLQRSIAITNEIVHDNEVTIKKLCEHNELLKEYKIWLINQLTTAIRDEQRINLQ